MRVELYTDPITGPHVTVILSRRNLRTLLAKLDGHPTGSKLMLRREGWSLTGEPSLTVTAEEDRVHYADRVAGAVHPDTEGAI